MNSSRVFVRTELGNELLKHPYGKIGGDARRLLALVDGNTSVKGINQKVPLSVQVKLNEIFEHLLVEKLVRLKARAVSNIPQKLPGTDSYERTIKTAAFGVPSSEGKPPSNELELAGRRNFELELELAEVRLQLEATKTRLQQAETARDKLEAKVSASGKSQQTLPKAKSRQIDSQKNGGTGVFNSLDFLDLINQELSDQKEILDKTLKLSSYEKKLSSEQPPGKFNFPKKNESRTNPHYKKLRGLEFFKGFDNDELIHFLSFAKWQTATSGSMILQEGEVGMAYFIIVSGSVTIIKTSRMIARLGRGEFFGEFAYLSGDKPLRTEQAQAETDCELLMIEPMDVEFSSVQLRLHVVEALLHGLVKRAILSSQRIETMLSLNEKPAGHE